MFKKGYKQTKEHIEKRMRKWEKWYRLHLNYNKREKNPRWKGGRRKYYQYIQILKPNYPSSTKSGYILEHRYIIEQYLRRPLTTNEVVHHKNGNPIDNRIENLQLMTKNEHSKVHPENIKNAIKFNKGRKLSKEHRQKISIGVKKHLPKTEFKKGHIPWSKLHPELCKSNSGSFKKGIIPWIKGKHHSKESKKKMSQAVQKYLNRIKHISI